MADDNKKSTGFVGKLMATVFGAVVAPILVALGVKVLPDMFAGKAAPTTQSAPSPEVAKVEPTSKGPKKHETNPPPVVPPTTHKGRPGHTGPAKGNPPPPPPLEKGNDDLTLITPKLGDNFYSYSVSEKKPTRNEMVDPAMFKYVPLLSGGRSIDVSGAVPGALMTKKDYENYSLSVEFRWGEKTYPPRETKARTAAILLHATGPDGAFEKSSPQCVAVLLTEGETGTIQLRGAPGKIRCIARMKESPDKHRREYVGGEKFGLPLVSGEPAGWDGLLYRLGCPDKLNDVKGRHPEGDPANQGDWNKVLLTCDGETVTVVVNEKRVNEITGLNLKKGRVGFTTSGADYTIRKVELETFRH